MLLLTLLLSTCRRLLHKHELVAPEPDAATIHFCQREASRPVEIEYLFRLGYLVRIAAYPVDDVAPAAHASLGTRLGPGAQVLAHSKSRERAQKRLRLRGRHHEDRKREPERLR